MEEVHVTIPVLGQRPEGQGGEFGALDGRAGGVATRVLTADKRKVEEWLVGKGAFRRFYVIIIYLVFYNLNLINTTNIKKYGKTFILLN